MVEFRTSWADAISTAPERIKIGQRSVFLWDAPIDSLDWSKVTKMEPGGSHRLDINTSVSFTFEARGLELRWYFDIEKPGANGSGEYQVDAEGIANVLGRLHGPAREEFGRYLRNCAVAIQKRGDELMGAATRQFGTAAALNALTAQEPLLKEGE